MSSAVSESLRAFFAVFARFENGWQSGVENVGTIRNWTINHFVNDTKYSTQLPEKFPWELLFFVSLKKMSAHCLSLLFHFPGFTCFVPSKATPYSSLLRSPLFRQPISDSWDFGKGLLIFVMLRWMNSLKSEIESLQGTKHYFGRLRNFDTLSRPTHLLSFVSFRISELIFPAWENEITWTNSIQESPIRIL